MTIPLDQTFRGHHLSFQYPSNWELTEEHRSDAITITVADGAAFWSLTVFKIRPRPESILDQACDAFREEYEEIDEYPATAELAGESSIARTLEFVSLELINCAFLQAAKAGGVTLFVLAQATDHERTEYEPVFSAITASVQRDPDETILIN